ncbi:MAG: glycosyltransferase [Flavobacteriaceae bacterium]|nr:glycosyltransferase [Flavobacteriaceae bacterium]
MNRKKRILIALLNWGLGHATRCMPIINTLIRKGFEPVLASDGEALRLLRKEYPAQESIELPSYHIRYPSKGKFLKWHLVLNSPKVIKAIKTEKLLINELVLAGKIDGIISDNRLGVCHTEIPSVIITHQLKVLSGQTSWLSSWIHQRFIKSFDQCWVPDIEDEPNLSGALGHIKSFSVPIKYLGIISRFTPIKRQMLHDLIVILSGPEPQRSILEKQLLNQLESFPGKILFVQGNIDQVQTKKQIKNIQIINFMLAEELERAINESEIVLARSGYTTLMDLARLKKKAFLIPTPGQYEQEYLAKQMHKKGIAPYCNQNDFTSDQLNKVKDYSGFKSIDTSLHIEELLCFFEGE